MDYPENTDDVIDSRDVIEAIDELGSFGTLDDEDRERLKALVALEAEAEGYAPDWQDGAGLIRDSYFETYAQELADDIGAIDPKASWPLDCIDWSRAARELKMDYTAVEFDGVTYWVRS
jgi:hypothetical protein